MTKHSERHTVAGARRGLNLPLARNIDALMERRRREQQEAPRAEKLATAIANFTGSMWSVLLHGVVFGGWIVANVVPGLPIAAWDPTLVVLAMIASVEAIFLSTFVLMNQNRIARSADQRSDLTLQISLLAEHEITRLVALSQAIAERLSVEVPAGNELAEISRDVEPSAVLDEIARKDRALELES